MISDDLQGLQDTLRCVAGKIYSLRCTNAVDVTIKNALIPVDVEVDKAVRGLDAAVGAALRVERHA